MPQPATQIVCIGDSITDMQRRDIHAPLGNGYVRLLADMLAIRQPSRRFAIFNRGVGGQTIRELCERWGDDVLALRPDILVMMIGINDLCGSVVNNGRGVSPEAYEAMYDAVLERTRALLPRCRILLLEPFYISQETDASSLRHVVLQGLGAYRRAVGRITRRHDTLRIETHRRFQQLLRHHDTSVFCPEPVHPNATGHMALAEWVYGALFAPSRHARPSI